MTLNMQVPGFALAFDANMLSHDVGASPGYARYRYEQYNYISQPEITQLKDNKTPWKIDSSSSCSTVLQKSGGGGNRAWGGRGSVCEGFFSLSKSINVPMFVLC